MALCAYHPEMGEKKPEVEIEASLSYYGKHYFVKSKNEIPVKQGIEFLNVLKASELTPEGQKKVGWFEYKMTCKAFEKLCAKSNVGYEMLLD